MKLPKSTYSLLGLGLLAGGTMASLQGCDELGNIAKECGLECSEDAFLSGQANISGNASIDAFFSASLQLTGAMDALASDLRAELDGIAVSVGLEKGAAGADIAAAVNAKFSAAGSVSIEFQPPRCEVAIEASATAAAECDVEVDPGSVEVACEGSCEAEANVMVDCGAEAELKCTGTAPNLQCDGMCQGSCKTDVSAGAACEGTCSGTCMGTCELMDGMGNCQGKCDGTCMGTCEVELKAEASCSGSCEGQCTYTPPDGMCEASASAKCEAMAGGSVQCSGKCEGNFDPPSVSAECEATVEAKASASAECFPPELAIKIEFTGSLDAQGQAEFKAWLEGFKGHYSAILAARARADLILKAAGNLSAAGEGAVSAVVDDLSASGSIKAKFGAVCAISQLPDAVSVIGSATGSLSGEVSAAGELTAAISG